MFKLPCEYLRVYTPSAEALGHAPGQEILQVGKEDVTIEEDDGQTLSALASGELQLSDAAGRYAFTAPGALCTG